MNSTKQWEADGYEIEINGQSFLVNADFKWERDSVDYQFDPRRGFSGQGRDTLADVAFEVDSLEIFGPVDMGEAVEISLVKTISEKILDIFRNSQKGCKNVGFGAWM